MWIPSDETKFSSKFQYIELARFVPSLNRVVRESNMRYDKEKGKYTVESPKIYKLSEIESYRKKHANSGIYSSVFNYENESVEDCLRMGSLYFDLDSANAHDAHEDTKKLVNYFLGFINESEIRIYFTGMKGFHLEVEALTLGVGASKDPSYAFRAIAKNLTEELKLSTVDFQCYDARRIWRLPNSQHQKTELFKIGISVSELNGSLEDIHKLAKEPRWDYEVPEPKFNAKANEWFREFLYKQEVQDQDPFERIRRFEQFGTGMVVGQSDADMDFDPERLFKGCPSLMRHWKSAEKNHHLSHEARLFLCSILTYSPAAESYLHQILSNCDDYDPERTQSHIDDWKRRRELGIGGRPFTCAKANAMGVGCNACDLEPREKLESINGQLVRTGDVASPSPIRFGYTRSVK